jgi:phenylpyruvate tautomerase PptA (4-oxalocrotonate tautomerase family)
MPLIKIELKEGRGKAGILKLRDIVMDCVVNVLMIPADERNIRVLEYREDYFQMKPPYEILIEISMFSGRTREIKNRLFQSLVNTLEDKLGIGKEKIFILLNEQPHENWGIRGGIPTDQTGMFNK